MTAPSSCSPLTFVQGDQGYVLECEIEIDPGAVAGIILFYDRQLYAGLGFDPATDSAVVAARMAALSPAELDAAADQARPGRVGRAPR